MSGPIQIEDVRRLDVRPGDRLLIKMPMSMSMNELDSLEKNIKRILGEDIKILVVTPNVDVSVIRPDGEAGE